MARECQVPTRPRIKALLLKQGLLSSYYPSKIVIAIGIASTMCGVTLAIFGGVAYIIETPIPAICSGIWVGLLVAVKGIIAVLSGNRPYSGFLLYFNLFAAILSTATTGFMSIVTASTVVNEQNSDSKHEPNYAKLPTLMINSLLLVISSLTCVLSLVNFCINGREACQCYAYENGILGINDPINHLALNAMEKRNRIISWIADQSTTKQASSSSSVECCAQINSKKKLKPLNSSSTVSTRLSGYVS